MSAPQVSDGSIASAETHSPRLPDIAGFEIIEELGRGGMGVVYKALELSSRRLVAIKLIRDGALADSQQRARFRIEAEAASRMRHPNIVAIHAVGDQDGQPFYAMDFIAGGSLEKSMAGKSLPAIEAARIVHTLALAVDHAHSNQIVHRDLKPSNILLRRGSDSDASFVPLIVDFGLAKRLDSESTAWTQAGAVVGTAKYMAPEQAAGKASVVGPAADVYSLGAILYELLTGRPPFQADAWQELLEQVLHSEPAPPTRLVADLPRDLETVCLKCLEKAPSGRYASAADLAGDLGRFVSGEPVIALPVDRGERIRRLAAHDGYELVEEIGHGPRSIVYRALHGPLRQTVAVKVFTSPLVVRDEWEAGLRRAAEIWATLSHPQIVVVQRVGWWDEQPYLAVEHAPQGTLSASLAGRPYGVAEALSIVERLADAVSYMHRQGVVHGNLKPQNVLLAANGIPRVVDLQPTGGLFYGQWDDGAPREFTSAYRYLAPEQVEAPKQEPRPHADTYGLGLILYELLTGQPAFNASEPREIIEQVRRHEPAPPSSINPHVTPALDAICLRCLRKNPWKRFERVYDLSKWMRTFLDNPRRLQIRSTSG